MALEETSPNFRFLSLPAELRNRTYELVLEQPYQIQLPSSAWDERVQSAVQPALARVNRQIRNECLPIFYHINEFCFDLYGCDFGYFFDFMEAIGVNNRRHIQFVCLNVQTRLICGDGLLDYVRWWTKTEGTENILISRTGKGYYERHEHELEDILKDAKTLEEYHERKEYFLDDTLWLLNQAVHTAHYLKASKTTRELAIRAAWKGCLDGSWLACFNCPAQGQFRRPASGLCSRSFRML